MPGSDEFHSALLPYQIDPLRVRPSTGTPCVHRWIFFRWLRGLRLAIVWVMSLASNAVGAYGERRAVDYLIHEAGMHVLDRNWRCADGEIDIVARDADAVVFIEVKTRRDHDFGPPAEAVIVTKQHRLRRLAARWLAEHPGFTEDIRFDVVSVLRPRRGPAQIEHVRAAF